MKGTTPKQRKRARKSPEIPQNVIQDTEGKGHATPRQIKKDTQHQGMQDRHLRGRH